MSLLEPGLTNVRPGGTGSGGGGGGTDGREVELQKGVTHIQWRYVGEVTWRDLVALSELMGPAGADGSAGAPGADGDDGREIELQTSGTHVQWRYLGDPGWTDLVALADITGPQGADGTAGADGAAGADGREVEIQKGLTHVQWRYVGAGTWTDLVALADITGPAGPAGLDGDDGREIEVQKGTTHLQWRYVGDVTWIDLVALADITGPQGDPGVKGDQGNPGPNEVTTATDTTISGLIKGSAGKVAQAVAGTDYPAVGHNHDAAYAPIAKGVTNGDSHDHVGGDGAQIDHVNLANKGTNTHAQVDSHLGAAAPHSGHEATANKGAANGYAGLGAGGVVPDAQLPAYLPGSAFSGLAKITVGTSAPGSPSAGDLWVDTS